MEEDSASKATGGPAHHPKGGFSPPTDPSARGVNPLASPREPAHPPTSLFRKKLGKNYWGTIHRPPNPLKTLRGGANLPSASTGWIDPPFTRESQIRSPACYRRRYPRAMFFVSLCCKKFP